MLNLPVNVKNISSSSCYYQEFNCQKQFQGFAKGGSDPGIHNLPYSGKKILRIDIKNHAKMLHF